MSEARHRVLHYHEVSKHSFQGYAPGPGGLDWANQPDPFRRYRGAPLALLDDPPVDDRPEYDGALLGRNLAPAPFDRRSVSQLFRDSLALSAWKQAGASRWALRVNPSSGNLHPTEGYLLCGPVAGLFDSPVVCHYAPREHALEVRARIPVHLWGRIIESVGGEVLLVGLTSIHWREAWKYGERAFRYCQHDVGHALGALAVSAAGLGWHARLLGGLSSEQVATLLGIRDARGPDAEQADCIVAVARHTQPRLRTVLDDASINAWRGLDWLGEPNALSSAHVHWPLLDEVGRVVRKPVTSHDMSAESDARWPEPLGISQSVPLRRILHQRRSAVATDGMTSMAAGSLFRMLARTLPVGESAPLAAWPWPARVHLLLFVHRVDGLPRGLYCLARTPQAVARLRDAMRPDFRWSTPAHCPDGAPLFLLAEADVRRAAMQLSCFQDIAGDGCFSVAMLAEFEDSLRSQGPWCYPRLFWEAGLIGQVLYLEAEAAGLRGTGIGCYFDDPVHQVFGLTGLAYQDLYHFTVGAPVEDARLTTRPPYPPPA